MSPADGLLMNYHSIRARLYHPSNAVPDNGIALRKARGVNGYEARRLAIEERRRREAEEQERRIAAAKALALSAMTPITGMVQSHFMQQPDFGPKLAAPTVRQIQAAVCHYQNVAMVDLLSARKTMPIVVPRQVAMCLAKALTRLSLPQIGRAFERDHTTVLHAIAKFPQIVETLRAMPGATLEQYVVAAFVAIDQ